MERTEKGLNSTHSCKARSVLSSVILILCLISAFPWSSKAADRELKSDTKEKSDVVLVLDASGSMLLTDPHRLRDQGAKLLLQFLKPGDRLGIVEFSNDAKIVRPLTELVAGSLTEAEMQIAGIGATGTYTDLFSGLSAAKDMFVSSGQREDASSVIIMLSDGKMEPDPSKGNSQSRTEALFNSLLPDLKSRGVKVYTVAFSDQADKDVLANIALGTEGINWFTVDADKLHQSYADLFLAVKKPQFVPLTGKGFTVDKDVDEITFYVSRGEGQTLELVTPSGAHIQKSTGESAVRWFSGEHFDVVTISKPESGDWQISGIASDDGFATILTNLKLRTDFEPSVPAETEVLVQARLYDSEKPISLPGMSGVTQFGLQVIPSDQISTPTVRVLLRDDGENGDKIANDGIFSNTIMIDEPGEYKLRIVAQSQTFTRSQQVPFRVRPALVSVQVERREITKVESILVESGESSGGGEGASHGGGSVASTADSSAEAHGSEIKNETSSSRNEDGSSVAEHKNENLSAHHSESSKEVKQEDESADLTDYEDVVVVLVSDEASKLKKLEVKLIAVDPKKVRIELPIKKIANGEGRGLAYEFAASKLPGAGKYNLQAFISGEARGGIVTKARSKVLQYDFVPKSSEEVSVVHLVNKSEAPKKEKSGFPIVELLIVLLANAGALGAAFGILQKVQGSLVVAVPRAVDPEHIEKMIAEYETKASASDVDLNDPMFSQSAANSGASEG